MLLDAFSKRHLLIRFRLAIARTNYSDISYIASRIAYSLLNQPFFQKMNSWNKPIRNIPIRAYT
jgi:hypothetical protein